MKKVRLHVGQFKQREEKCFFPWMCWFDATIKSVIWCYSWWSAYGLSGLVHVRDPKDFPTEINQFQKTGFRRSLFLRQTDHLDLYTQEPDDIKDHGNSEGTMLLNVLRHHGCWIWRLRQNFTWGPFWYIIIETVAFRMFPGYHRLANTAG